MALEIRDALNALREQVRTGFEAVDRRFDAIDTKLDDAMEARKYANDTLEFIASHFTSQVAKAQ